MDAPGLDWVEFAAGGAVVGTAEGVEVGADDAGWAVCWDAGDVRAAWAEPESLQPPMKRATLSADAARPKWIGMVL